MKMQNLLRKLKGFVMAYNLLGQPGPYGERNPDPNLTDEQATYLYDRSNQVKVITKVLQVQVNQ